MASIQTNSQPCWSKASQLATLARTCAKTIHRMALREGWPVRREGNRYFYLPPRSVVAGRSNPIGDAIVPQISRSRRAEMRRAGLRLAALDELGRFIEAGTGHEAALSQVASLFHFAVSPTALRRWELAYAREGIEGLLDHRKGHSGRPKTTQPR